MNAYTPISQIVQSIICVLCLLVAMPALSPLPKCILSAVVTISVYRLINNGITEFRFLYFVSKIELFEFCVALFAPLVIGLEIGIFVAIGSSIFVNFILRNSSVFVKINKLIKANNNDYVDQRFMRFLDVKSGRKKTVSYMEDDKDIEYDDDYDDNEMIDGSRDVSRREISRDGYNAAPSNSNGLLPSNSNGHSMNGHSI